MSIAYAFRPELRFRLTPADEPARGNLRFTVHWILTNVFATYADILTSASSISPFDLTSSYNRTLPYPYTKYMTQFRLYAWVPVYFRRGVAWPVSYYALFQGMAASKPTSWLSQQLYLLNHLVYIRDLNWRSGLFPSWPRILALVVSLLDSNITGIRSLTLFGTTFRRPHKTSALPPVR